MSTRIDNAESFESPLFSEFDLPMNKLFRNTVEKFTELEAPVLNSMPRISIDHLSTPSHDEGYSSGLVPIEVAGVTDHAELLNTDSGAWAALANHFGVELARRKIHLLVQTLNKVTSKTGNVVSSQGPMTHDVLLDVLETMEFEVNSKGEPVDLAMLVHPHVAQQIMALPPMTPEQDTRHKSIIRKQQERQNAEKRTRTLD